MSEQKKFLVKGVFNGRSINIRENAYSPKQAKFKAALDYKVFGKKVGGFIKSKNIKVVEV